MSPTPQYSEFFVGEDAEERQYWGDQAAGCIFVAKDTGRILLARRGADAEEPGTWGTWGGKIDGDESPKEAVKREVEEETGYDGITTISPLYVFQDGTFKYHNFLVIVPFEFTPQLNWENDGSAWVEYGKWPTPTHFGLETLIRHAGPKIKRVIELLNKKRNTFTESVKSDEVKVEPLGLIDISTRGYKWITPYGYLTFGHDETNRNFELIMIRTNTEHQNQGHSKRLLERFIKFVKEKGGTLDTGAFTTSGLAHTQHVIRRLAQQYGVRLV